MARAMAVLVLALFGAAAVSGCKRVSEGARESFSREFTCPKERVEVRARTDVKPSDLEARARPSKEVAADPQRLAMWQAQQDKNRQWADGHDEIFEVRGCDHQVLYACHRHNKDSNYIMCSDKPYPAGLAKW